jgi:hypothetical protein
MRESAARQSYSPPHYARSKVLASFSGEQLWSTNKITGANRAGDKRFFFMPSVFCARSFAQFRRSAED